MQKNIVIYGQVSCTDGNICYLGYEEGSPNTDDVITIRDTGEREPKAIF